MCFPFKLLTGRPKEGFKPESWAEIVTPDQFKTHAKRRLGGLQYIQSHEREQLELAIAQRGSITKNKTQCWGEHDLENILANRIPFELRPDLQIARPLLFRCMVRMSSCPFLDEPEPPGALTIADILAALSIILKRPSWLGRPGSMATVDATAAEKHARSFRALLFRSIRLLPKNALKDGLDVAAHRNEQDNEDLRQVHLLLTRSRRYHSERWPTKLKPGPPIITLEDLISSTSTNLKGSIPGGEFESFWRVCSYLESGELAVKPKTEDSHSPRDVDWKYFDAMIASAPVMNLDRLPTYRVSEMGNQSSFVQGVTLLFTFLISPVETGCPMHLGRNEDGKDADREDDDQIA